jgi:hypothetical protein
MFFLIDPTLVGGFQGVQIEEGKEKYLERTEK